MPSVRSFVIAVSLALGLSIVAPAVAHADPGAGYQMQTGEDQGGRSGFWTSRAPANGGAYRWRLLGIGVGLLCITGVGMIVLVRRAASDRDKRDKRG